MALIIEDGSIVAGADSYIDVSDARTLAEKWGIVLPQDDPALEVALRKGAFFNIVTNVVLDQDDYIKLQVSNESSTTNVTAELDSFFIVERR